MVSLIALRSVTKQPRTETKNMRNAGLERSLIWAVLERAILDAGGHTSYTPSQYGINQRKVTIRAKDWLFRWTDNEDLAKPFSFPWVCHYLDLEPQETMRKIRKELKKEKLTRGLTKYRTKGIAGYFENQRSPTESEVYYL